MAIEKTLFRKKIRLAHPYLYFGKDLVDSLLLYYLTKTDGTALSESILYFTVDTGLAPTILSQLLKTFYVVTCT